MVEDIIGVDTGDAYVHAIKSYPLQPIGIHIRAETCIPYFVVAASASVEEVYANL